MPENSLKERINQILAEQNLKKIDFASSLGISANYVSLLTAGKKESISGTLAKLIENIYGYSAQWIMTGEGEPRRRVLKLRQTAIQKIREMDLKQLKQVSDFIQKLEQEKE